MVLADLKFGRTVRGSAMKHGRLLFHFLQEDSARRPPSADRCRRLCHCCVQARNFQQCGQHYDRRSNCLTQIKAQEKANVRNCKLKCSFFSIFSLYLLLEKPWQYLQYSQLCANHRQPMQIFCNWTSFDNHPYYWWYGGSWYFNSVQRWIIAFKTCWWSIQAGWTTS